MLSRFWNYLTENFRGSPANIAVVAPQYPKVHAHPPRSLLGLQNAQLHSAHEHIAVEYKLALDEGITPKPSQEQQQNFELHADILDQVQQLSANLEKLRVSEEELARAKKNYPDLVPRESLRGHNSASQVRRQFELKKQYEEDVVNFLGLKYSRQKSEYPAISLDQYRVIRQYWKNKTKGHLQIKNTGFDCVQKLTYKAMGGLNFGEWLNDDVINIYTEMMEKRFIRECVTPYKILNSYFATNTLTKTDTQIQRILKKKALDKNHILIMPVNNRNHWYFAVFDRGQLTIYDSMKHSQNYYLENPIFKNSLKFAKMFYEKQYKLVVRQDFPQQDNYYDCGVFMLMGIRDILRHKQWSYHQGDIRFKRIQIAHEILEENLIYAD